MSQLLPQHATAAAMEAGAEQGARGATQDADAATEAQEQALLTTELQGAEVRLHSLPHDRRRCLRAGVAKPANRAARPGFDAADAAEPSFLPPFANDENRALDAHIQVSTGQHRAAAAAGAPASAAARRPPCLPPPLALRRQDLERQLQAVDLELEENASRAAIMSDHLKNVQQEITYAQHRVRLRGWLVGWLAAAMRLTAHARPPSRAGGGRAAGD